MTVEQMQLICNMITNKDVIVKRTNRDSCSIAGFRNKQRTIIIANFIFSYPDEIQLAEIIHESIHHISDKQYGLLSHGFTFKQKETYWLQQFGLYPVNYKRAYYRKLQLWNNKIIPLRSLDYSEQARVAAGQKQQLIQKAKQLKQKKTKTTIQL